MKIRNLSIVVALAVTTGAFAADSVTGMFEEGKVSGQIREYTISRSVNVSSGNDYCRRANAIGGYVKYETGSYKDFQLGVTGFTTNGFLLDSPKTDLNKVDPTLLGKDNDSYTMVGEAYVQYSLPRTTFRAGRQRIETPLMGSDDARMLPNSYEAIVVTNTSFPDVTLFGAHVTKFAQGTYGRVKTSGISSITAGYSNVDAKNNVGDFTNMGTYAVGQSTEGVTVASVKYNATKNLQFQLWDYYAHDILNAVYAQVDYKYGDFFTAAQYIKESDVGGKYLGEIDSQFYGVKAGMKSGNLTGTVSYSEASKNDATDAAVKHTVVTMWGGMPAFTRGMVSRQMFMAGTKATKTELSYDWKNFGPNIKTSIYSIFMDMNRYSGYSYNKKASEKGFDVSYAPSVVKNLQLAFKGNFPEEEKVNGATQNWSEYRFIANYNF